MVVLPGVRSGLPYTMRAVVPPMPPLYCQGVCAGGWAVLLGESVYCCKIAGEPCVIVCDLLENGCEVLWWPWCFLGW